MNRLTGGTRLSLACHGLLDLIVGSWFFLGSMFLAWVLYCCIAGKMEWAVDQRPERILITTLIGLFLLFFGTASLVLLLRSATFLWSAVSGRAASTDRTAGGPGEFD